MSLRDTFTRVNRHIGSDPRTAFLGPLERIVLIQVWCIAADEGDPIDDDVEIPSDALSPARVALELGRHADYEPEKVRSALDVLERAGCLERREKATVVHRLGRYNRDRFQRRQRERDRRAARSSHHAADVGTAPTSAVTVPARSRHHDGHVREERRGEERRGENSDDSVSNETSSSPRAPRATPPPTAGPPEDAGDAKRQTKREADRQRLAGDEFIAWALVEAKARNVSVMTPRRAARSDVRKCHDEIGHAEARRRWLRWLDMDPKVIGIRSGGAGFSRWVTYLDHALLASTEPLEALHVRLRATEQPVELTDAERDAAREGWSRLKLLASGPEPCDDGVDLGSALANAAAHNLHGVSEVVRMLREGDNHSAITQWREAVHSVLRSAARPRAPPPQRMSPNERSMQNLREWLEQSKGTT